jgi:hypothetical protein
VVVSVDFFVDVESPIGDTVVPLEVDPDVLVVTPCAVELFWLLVSTETDGATTAGAVVVVVELEDDVSARATPLIRETAIMAARNVLIMSYAPGNRVRTGIARYLFGHVERAVIWRQDRKLLNQLKNDLLSTSSRASSLLRTSLTSPATTRVALTMPFATIAMLAATIAIAAARSINTTTQGQRQ